MCYRLYVWARLAAGGAIWPDDDKLTSFELLSDRL